MLHSQGRGDLHDLFDGCWDDGRPKRWPTAQLRIRGRAFDVYCAAPGDVTLDRFGIPVVAGQTARREDLARGWMAVEAPIPVAPTARVTA